jgi:hypothetical protein
MWAHRAVAIDTTNGFSNRCPTARSMMSHSQLVAGQTTWTVMRCQRLRCSVCPSSRVVNWLASGMGAPRSRRCDQHQWYYQFTAGVLSGYAIITPDPLSLDLILTSVWVYLPPLVVVSVLVWAGSTWQALLTAESRCAMQLLKLHTQHH